MAAPGPEKVCAAQGWQAEGLAAPAAALAVPAAQRLHALAPGSAQEPGAQHTWAPLGLPVPLAHGVHVALPGCAKVLAAQGTQVVPLAAGENPALQLLHADMALLGTPGEGHNWQDCAPGPLTVAGGHTLHALALGESP